MAKVDLIAKVEREMCERGYSSEDGRLIGKLLVIIEDPELNRKYMPKIRELMGM